MFPTSRVLHRVELAFHGPLDQATELGICSCTYRSPGKVNPSLGESGSLLPESQDNRW